MKNAVRFLALAMMLSALPASAQWDWSSVGSTGVPDDTTTGTYTTTGPVVAIRTDSVAELQYRYPVTNTVGSSSDISPAWTTLQMSYVDSGINGSVVAALKAVDKCSNQETTLCSITSNDGTTAVQCDTCTFSGGLDFANKAYYVDVLITKTDVPPVEELYQLAIY